MATWSANSGRLYLPPAKPVATVMSTDDYVKPTNLYFHAYTERLLTVGHPYFDVINGGDNKTIEVPKVSGNQYRVLRLRLPDPNKFALVDSSIYDPQKERLVWKLSGLQIDRGGPLGVGTTGHPLFDRLQDTENPNVYPVPLETDNRENVSFDPKQNQLFIVGCTPATGQHWDVTDPCKDAAPAEPGSCPPIKLVHSMIEDGDMCDIGLGAVNFNTFSASRADAPLDVINSICKWPDFVQMTKDTYGNKVFFFGKREQLYTRHMFVHDGIDGDSLPTNVHDYYIQPTNGTPQKTNTGKLSYYAVPSGSLVSSEANLFNRPYWLHKAQGQNNGICWGNDLFITLLDNTHNTNFVLSVFTKQQPMQQDYSYTKDDFKKYLRHVEEIEVEIVMHLCKVPLEADVLAHINAMDPRILDEWELAFVPPPPQGLEDTYRYIRSLATMCPADVPPKTPEDRYKGKVFWEVDLRDKFTSELDQTPLGRKFLYQMGMITSRKRLRPSDYTGTSYMKRPAKKRRTKTK